MPLDCGCLIMFSVPLDPAPEELWEIAKGHFMTHHWICVHGVTINQG